jgi:hypothetical protein
MPTSASFPIPAVSVLLVMAEYEGLELGSVVETKTVVKTYRPKQAAQPPTKPYVLGFRLTRKWRFLVLVEVLISDALAADHVTSRLVDLKINGADQSPIDAISGPAIWTCNEGDQLDAGVTDTNAAGSTASDRYTGVATLPLTAPVQPSVTRFLFSAGGAPADPNAPVVNPLRR